MDTNEGLIRPTTVLTLGDRGQQSNIDIDVSLIILNNLDVPDALNRTFPFEKRNTKLDV